MHTIRGTIAIAAGVLAALLAGPVAAQTAGTVQFVSGTVEILRAAQRLPAQKGTALQQGDAVVTAAASSAQLLMVDGALVSLRPSTQMAIERYQFDEAQASAGEAMLALVRGTMRTFTGLIVARDREKFRMRTSIANLGIRGSGNILAHGDEAGTINHTLTGAHSVTAKDAAGVERTLVSYPGQTIQVLPGLAPRFIPTPPGILAGASQGTKSASAEEKAAEGTTTTSGSGAEEGTTVAEAAAPNPTLASSQAATSTAAIAIVSAQPVPALDSGLFRFAYPYAGGGWEGAFAQAGQAFVDSAGRLVLIRGGLLGTFLSGSGGSPPGYSPGFNFSGNDYALAGGTHRDGYRTPDGAVTIGRWEGGTVEVSGGSATPVPSSIPLGPQSAQYLLYRPTPPGIVASLTGSTTYTLVSATSPTDAFGHAGSVGAAQVLANFSNRTVSGNFALSINGQNLVITGTDVLSSPGPGAFTFLARAGFPPGSFNATVSCSGTGCAAQGYQTTMNGHVAGADARWIAIIYRINPERLPNSAYADHISGSMVLGAATPPTVGIQLPQTGTASLAFTGPSMPGSGQFGGQSFPTDHISGTLQANFSTRTVGFSATIGSSAPGSPTYVATTANAPIVGVGFAASTFGEPGLGTLAVTCTGSPCGAAGSGIGRFDGYFTASSGQQGQSVFTVGDALGTYTGGANFAASTTIATTSIAATRAADVQHGVNAIGAAPAAGLAASVALQASRFGRVRPR